MYACKLISVHLVKSQCTRLVATPKLSRLACPFSDSIKVACHSLVQSFATYAPKVAACATMVALTAGLHHIGQETCFVINYG